MSFTVCMGITIGMGVSATHGGVGWYCGTFGVDNGIYG